MSRRSSLNECNRLVSPTMLQSESTLKHNPDHAPEVQQHYLVMVIRSERLDVLWMKI